MATRKSSSKRTPAAPADRTAVPPHPAATLNEEQLRAVRVDLLDIESGGRSIGVLIRQVPTCPLRSADGVELDVTIKALADTMTAASDRIYGLLFPDPKEQAERRQAEVEKVNLHG